MGTRAWGVAALLMGVLWVSPALAVDWSVVPSVTAKTEFNSNINYSFENKVSDYILTLSPGVDFNRTTEISQLQGRLGLSGQHYLSHGNIDHIDQNYQINGWYQAAPRWKLALTSSYIVDTTLQQELKTSGLIMTRTPRQSIQAGPAVTYNVTERLAATVNYNFNRVNYQSPGFQNYTYQGAGLRLDYPLKNEKTVLVGNILVRETKYSGTNKFQSVGTYLGVIHKFRENWEVSLMAGANLSYLNFSTQVVQSPQSFVIVPTVTRFKETRGSPYISLSTTRRWTNLSFTGGVSRDESPTAYGSISELYRVYGSATYQYSEKLSGILTGDYYLSLQSSQQNNLENAYFSISPQLSYRITEKLTASPGYGFGLWNDMTNARSAMVHSVWLMLTYTYPLHYRR